MQTTHQTTTWILIANSSNARLYSTHNSYIGGLELINEFNHPSSRLKGIDLVSDRPGHYQSRGSGHGALIEHSQPKEVEAERFALELANALENGRIHNRYDKLTLIAPAHFQGLMNKHLNHHINEKLTKKILKDYTKSSLKQLETCIHAH
jgi:protein required for attachment to host cells